MLMRRSCLIHDAAEANVEALAGRMSFEDARDQYQSLIFAFVSRRIRPVEEAEDITAHVFVDAYKSWRRLKGPAKHWLLGIARRKVCDALRRRRGHWSIDERDSAGNALDEFVASAESRQAMQIVHSLPDDQRDAFLMQILEGLSIEDIAKILKRSPASVNSLLQRARARIQKTLGSQTREGVGT
jgi:RNA polymerase sigma-70 factor, ECF subfamily